MGYTQERGQGGLGKGLQGLKNNQLTGYTEWVGWKIAGNDLIGPGAAMAIYKIRKMRKRHNTKLGTTLIPDSLICNSLICIFLKKY